MLNWHRRDTTPFPREAFFPGMLFRDGTDGLWPDPSDMSTMFQDSAGTAPVAAPGETVGLMLDKSRGLVKGSNAAAAGPTTVFAPWVSLGGGRYSIDGTQTSYQSLYYEGILEVGETYEVTFTVENTNGAIRIASQLNSIDLVGTGEKRAHLVAAAGNFNIQAPPGVVATIEVGEVRKVPGNHLTQPTASKRPIYGVVPSSALKYLPELVPDRWVENPTGIWGGNPAVQFSRDDTHAKQGTHSLQFASGPAAGFYDMFSLTDLEIGEVVTYGVWVYRADENANSDFGWSLNGGWGVVSLNALPVGKWTYVTATAASPVAGASDLELRAPSEQAIGNLWFDGLTIKRHKQGGRRNLLNYSKELTLARWPSAGTSASFDPSDIIAPDGSKTAVRAISGGGGSDYLYRDAVASDGQIKSIYARTVSGTGTVGLLDFNGTPRSEASLTEEWQRFELPVNTADTGGANFYLVDFRVGTLDEVLIWGPQLEEGSEATPYQRTGNQYDVTERGVETLHYLHFDGVDDEMTIASRFGMSANPAVYASFGWNAEPYVEVVQRMFHIGGAGDPATLAGSLGSEGLSWRHNGGARFFGPVAAEETRIVSFLRNEGDTFGNGRAFVDGVERAETGVGNATGVPSNTDAVSYIASGGFTNYLGGEMFGAVLTASALDESARGKIERYLARKSGVTL